MNTWLVSLMSVLGLTSALAEDAHDGVQLWENGPYWAVTNLGAEKESDVGYYYQWGGTTGYAFNGGWKDQNGKSAPGNWYNGSPTYQIDNGVLKPESDAAHALWGGSWRLPTAAERDKLNTECTFTWTTRDGRNGGLFTGKGAFSDKSIFIPDGGWAGAPGGGCAYYFTGSVAQNGNPTMCSAYYFFPTAKQIAIANVHRGGKAYTIRAVCDQLDKSAAKGANKAKTQNKYHKPQPKPQPKKPAVVKPQKREQSSKTKKKR